MSKLERIKRNDSLRYLVNASSWDSQLLTVLCDEFSGMATVAKWNEGFRLRSGQPTK